MRGQNLLKELVSIVTEAEDITYGYYRNNISVQRRKICKLAMPYHKSRCNNQLISNASNGLNFHIALLEFPTQMRYMDVHRTGLAVEVKTPGLLQKLLTAQ